MERKSLNTNEYIKLVKESPEKKKGYIFAGVTVLISIVLIVFAIRPTVETIIKINKEIKEKDRVSKTLDTKINTLSALDKKYSELKTDMSNLKLIFPADGNFSLFMSNIESVVSRNGFNLMSINFEKYNADSFDSSTKVLIPWSVRLSVKGKNVNLVNLLKDLESLPMYPVIEGVSFSSQKDKDGLTSFGINLRIYRIDNDKFYE